MPDQDPSQSNRKRLLSRRRLQQLRPWLLPAAAFAVALLISIILWGKMRREVWAYYSDGEELKAELDENKARPVLWQDPEAHHFEEGDGATPGKLEAAFSADGTMMVVVYWDESRTNADMYASRWDGRRWSKPEPLESVNTEANERSPAFSRDGRYLYFASDRKGGKGGYDLYVARAQGEEWAGVEALPGAVNSSSNELGPAVSADGAKLYFSSDRDGGDAEDIFVAGITVPKEAKAEPKENRNDEKRRKNRKGRRNAAELARVDPDPSKELAPMPKFGTAEPVDDLNSKADDVQAALTARGHHVFLASDRERDKKSGFKVYISRVIDGEPRPPEEVDLYIDTGDVTDPAVRMEGFDLLFSAGSASDDGEESDYRLYRSTTREVIGYTDMTRWQDFKELISNIAWWILLALVALIALIYILESWRDITSLFHKCLAGSAVLHLLGLLLAMLWLIVNKIEEEERKIEEEVVIDMDALAQEELAMESIPEETTLPETTTNLESEKVESEFGAPGFEPQEENEAVPVAATAKEAEIVEAQPAMSESTDQPVPEPVEESSLLNELAAAALPEIDQPTLEERDPTEPQPVADTSNETFEPDQPTPETTEKMEPQELADAALDSAPSATLVTEAQPTEPLEEQPKEPEFVESTITETPPEPVETTPLESAVLDSLPEAVFVDPTESTFEERSPANPATSEVADTSQDMFEPGDSAPSLTTEQSAPGESSADSAETSASGTADVAEGDLDAGAQAVGTVAANIGESSPEAAMPSNAGPSALPDSSPFDPGTPKLDEPNTGPVGTPADVAGDIFEPDATAPGLSTEQAEGSALADSAVTAESQSTDVAGGQAEPTSAVSGMTTAIAQSSPSTTGVAGLAPGALPETTLLDPGSPKLDEGTPALGDAPADTLKDQFQPGATGTNLATAPAEGSAPSDSAVASASDTTAVSGSALVADSAVAGSPAAAESNTPMSADTPALAAGALPETTLLDPGAPRLEEGNPNSGGTPADLSKDQFKPGAPAQNLATNPATGSAPADSAVAAAGEATEVTGSGMVAASAVAEGEPTEAKASMPTGDLPSANLSPLPDVTLVSVGSPKLEERGSSGGRADTSKEQFEPGAVASNLATAKADGPEVKDSAVGGASGSTSVATVTLASAGDATMLRNDLAATGLLPDLELGGLASTLADASPLPSPGLPNALEAPEGLDERKMASLLQKERGKPGLETIKEMGGSEGSEKGIAAAMKWLSENQEPDGRWDTRKHGAVQNYDTGGVSLALLCYYGWGERHDKKCKYQKNVRSALDWLLTQQRKDGYLGGGPRMMYSHAIATIALCEAYGLTKDKRLREPSERAIAYTLAAQSKTKGGWRYSPGNDSDTSVTGWQFMALHSARMAGIEVPERSFERARKFLDRMGGGKHGGLYGYQVRGKLSRAMVATGMFCRQLDLVPPTDPRQQESARMLKLHKMKASKPDLYYVYYATLALYQHQGPIWQDWNKRLQEILPQIQKKTGKNEGSWDPSSSMTADGGRVVSTTLATLSLEVYYRLLPMYGFRNKEAEAPEKKLREN